MVHLKSKANGALKLPVNYKALDVSQVRLVREAYISEQGGLCQHCGDSLAKISETFFIDDINKKLFPAGFFKHPVHLHHDHDTSMTIGAVHAICNAHSWEYNGV